MGHLQLAPLTLLGAQGDKMPLSPLAIPENYFVLGRLKGPAANVGAIYADLYRELTEGSHAAPTFKDAVRIHRLLAAMETAASTGQRQQV